MSIFNSDMKDEERYQRDTFLYVKEKYDPMIVAKKVFNMSSQDFTLVEIKGTQKSKLLSNFNIKNLKVRQEAKNAVLIELNKSKPLEKFTELGQRTDERQILSQKLKTKLLIEKPEIIEMHVKTKPQGNINMVHIGLPELNKPLTLQQKVEDYCKNQKQNLVNFRREHCASLRKPRKYQNTKSFLLSSPFWKERKERQRLNHSFSDLISDSELEKYREKIRRDYLCKAACVNP